MWFMGLKWDFGDGQSAPCMGWRMAWCGGGGGGDCEVGVV